MLPNKFVIKYMCTEDSYRYYCYSKINTYNKTKIYYDKADYDTIKNELNDAEWINNIQNNQEDINKQWEIFTTKVNQLIKNYVPHKIITNNRKRKFPIDKETQEIIHNKHKLWKQYFATKDLETYKKFCKIRNKVKSITKKTQRNYENSLAKKAKDNPKAIWQYINSKSKIKEGITELNIDPNNSNSKLTSNNQEKSEILNNYFSSVFTIEPDGEMPAFQPDLNVQETMKPLSIKEEQVKKILQKLKISKSPGPDGLHPRFLRELAPQLCKPLTLIFNNSLRLGKLPTDWKNGQITAIYKKGKKACAGNYRPVSLTSVIAKSMEKIIREHTMKYFLNNKLFTNKQFGFLNGRSTSLQLLNVLDKWTKYLDEGRSVDCIYMDFQKCFDTVPHKRLIHKLKSYGINKEIILWMTDFLIGRKQRVSIQNSFSQWMLVLSGIPQGSVLGPLLFVIYINELPKTVKSTIYLFADDTKIFRSINDQNDVKILQEDLNTLQDWSDTWLLKFHPDKCKRMTIGKQNEHTQVTYTLNIEKTIHNLENVDQEKDIGVIIDSNLEFDKHINAKINKANSMFSIIRRSFQFLSQQNFIPLYKSLVRSHLDYASSVWNPYKQKHIDALENVQRRATRQLPTLSKLPYEERLQTLKLPTLAYRRVRGDMIEVYKIMNEIYDTDVTSFLKTRVQSAERTSQRGHKFQLYTEHINKNIRKHSFAVRVINIWNSLPKEVAEAPSINSFKNRLDKYWSTQELVYNYKAKLSLDRKSAGGQIDYEDLDIVAAD